RSVLESLPEGSLDIVLRTCTANALESPPAGAAESAVIDRAKATPSDSWRTQPPQASDFPSDLSTGTSQGAASWITKIPQELKDHPRYTVLEVLKHKSCRP